MARPQLPAACHWAGTAAQPLLMYNFGVIAHISAVEGERTAMVHLNFRGSHINAVHRGGIESAKRFIERWVAARLFHPYSGYRPPAKPLGVSDAAYRIVTARTPRIGA